MPPVKVTATLTRNYGSYTSSWGAEIEADVKTRKDLIDAYAGLHEHIKACILDFEANMLRTLPAAQGRRQAPLNTSTQSIDKDEKGAPKAVWAKAVSMFAEFKKGKHYFYIQTWEGTKWSKHGVPCYLDNFTGLADGIVDKLKEGEVIKFEPDMYVAIVTRFGRDYGIALMHKDMIDAED